jgi:hypothetical protein
MRGVKSLLVCGLVVAFAGCASKDGGPTAGPANGATVRAFRGDVQYSVRDGQKQSGLSSMRLLEGSVIQTGSNSIVDLQINGRASIVRLMGDTVLGLHSMSDLGAGDSETMLNLDKGTLLGSVKNRTKNSRFEVETARGVAGMRAPCDFVVQVVPNPDGLPKLTFTCVTGQLYCVANMMISGQTAGPPFKILTSGQSWTPPDTAASPEDMGPVQVLPEVLRLFATNRPGSPIKAP